MSKQTMQNIGLISAVIVAIYLVDTNIIKPYIKKRSKANKK